MGSSKLELRMKSLLILALAGLASSYQAHHQYFSTGQEHVYNYSGRILTGIPQIDSTFAGMSMEGQVIVQAISQNSVKMMMRNVKFGTFNDHLSGSSQQPTNWRNVQLESSTPLSSQYQQYMEAPVGRQLQEGSGGLHEGPAAPAQLPRRGQEEPEVLVRGPAAGQSGAVLLDHHGGGDRGEV